MTNDRQIADPRPSRIDWIDQARGLCIILVVMMHSTLGVGLAMDGEGWMHGLVAFAEPFRVPAFFVVAGLFAHRVLGWTWRRFVDRRILHYVYFYCLWVSIQFAFKAPGMVADAGIAAAVEAYLMAFVQPFGTLWFIYMLPIFFLVVRLTAGLPPLPVLAVALAAHLAPIDTGWLVIDELAGCLVFFLAGHLLRDQIVAFASAVARRPLPAILLLVIWLPLHALVQGSEALPGTGLLLAIFGTAALVAVAVAASLLRPRLPALEGLAWIGRHSLIIYLAFFLPMAVMRTVLVSTGIVTDVGLVSLLTTIAALAGPVIAYQATRITGLGRFLFERPRVAMYERRAADRAPMPAE